jgi:hypothetical protein
MRPVRDDSSVYSDQSTYTETETVTNDNDEELGHCSPSTKVNDGQEQTGCQKGCYTDSPKDRPGALQYHGQQPDLQSIQTRYTSSMKESDDGEASQGYQNYPLPPVYSDDGQGDDLFSPFPLRRTNVFAQHSQPPPLSITTRFHARLLKSSNVLRRHPTALPSLVPLITSIIWLILLFSLMHYYLTLPRHPIYHTLPQISYTYSVSSWPYISCIGAKLPTSFQASCITCAITNDLSFLAELLLTHRTLPPGQRYRYAKATAGLLSSAPLVALSYFSVESHPNTHLNLASLHIVLTGCVRLFDALVTHSLLNVIPHNRPLTILHRVKTATSWLVAVPTAIAIVGIYGCRDRMELMDPSTKCWNLVRWAAPCEWVIGFAWSVFLVYMAVDILFLPGIKREVDVALRGSGRSIEMTKWQRSQLKERVGKKRSAWNDVVFGGLGAGGLGSRRRYGRIGSGSSSTHLINEEVAAGTGTHGGEASTMATAWLRR